MSLSRKGLFASLVLISALLGPSTRLWAQGGSFAHAANVFSDNVSAYTIDAMTGVLTPVSGAPFPTGTSPFFVMVDPTGRFVYVANVNSHDVSAYAIEATTGALTPVPGSPFSAGAGRNEVTVDPSGQFVYVVNGAGDVSAYTIDPGSGALTSIPGWPFPAGSGSSGVTVDPRVASSTLPIKRPLTFPRTPLTPLPAPWPQGPVRRFRRD